MGSSSGGFFTHFDEDDFRKKITEAEKEFRDPEYELEADSLLANYLAKFNDRDTEAINQILEQVRETISEEFEGISELIFGGSVAKKTYVDGLSDVDALLLLSKSDVVEATPAHIKALCERKLKDIFGEDNVSAGSLAITITKGDTLLQILPALREGDHFKISDPNGREWSKIKPRTFAAQLTEANQKQGGKLVPTIKLAKAILGELPEERRLSGYHVEALAIKILSDYEGPANPRAMLRCFFEKAGTHVLQPIHDITGQSYHLDDYLGEARSLPRRVMADTLDRIGRRIKTADGAKDLGLWKQLLGDITT
jgi:hypothetical protein